MKKILAVLFSALLLCTCGAILSACGEPPHEHDYSLQIIGKPYLASEATCSSPAKYYYVCTCWEHGTLTYENGSALEHSYTNYVYNNDAECGIDGTETAYCDHECGESYTRTKEGSALQHTYTNYEYNNDAECGIDGTETAYCDHECGESHTRIKEDSALQHSYTNYTYDNNAKCGIDGTETAYCDHECGESHTRTKVGSALTHNYGDWISNGDDTHSKICSHDGTHIITENCSGGTATEQNKAICTTCGGEHGEKLEHVHAYNKTIVSEEYKAVEATCKTLAEYYYSCKCGQKGNTTFEYGNFASHKYTNYTYNNDAECEVNGTETAYCDYDCGKTHTREKIGTALNHKYTTYTFDNNAKCGIDGTETAYCDNKCGESHTRTKVNSALEHNYGYWISNGDDTHTKTCSHDSTHIITENCSGGEATCTQKAVCSSCNSEYGKLKDHPYSTEWTITETHHYHASTCDCKEKKDYGEHTPDDSGFCTACDKAINYTKGIIYDKSSDGTYADVIGYEGSSTKINIAPTYNNLPVKSIYDSAFRNTNITKVIIPDSVTSIVGAAFYSCDSLASVTIGDSVTSIGDYAFKYCDSLTSIVIPDSVTSIGDYAFEDCDSLTSVTIGDSVTSIGEQSFSSCSSLTSVTIGDSITSIGAWSFSYCSKLTSVTIGGSVTTIGSSAFYGCPDDLFNIEGNVKYLISGDNKYFAVLGVTNNNLSSYTIKDGAKIIATYAFSGCSRLSSIEIPDSVTSIGRSAFSSCSSLTSVTIPNSVTSIGEYAFLGCDSLTSVTFKDTSTWYKTSSYDNWINKTGGSQMDVTNPTANVSYLINSSYYNYYWYKL